MAVNKEDWRDLLEEYKNLPQLWHVSLEIYKNKNLRNKGWQKLLEIYKKIENNATLEQLKRKITNIRTSYRRELKKVIKSEKSGAGADEVYVPSLWYFDILDFLRDHEIPIDSTSTLTDSENEEVFETTKPIPSQKRQRKEYTTKKSDTTENENFLRRAVNYLESQTYTTNTKDDATIFGEGWACSFRKLNTEQQLYAKKIIDEALLLAHLNKLSFESSVLISETSSEIITKTPSPTSPLSSLDNFQKSQSLNFSRARVISNQPIVLPRRQLVNTRTYNTLNELLNDVEYT